MFEKFDGVLQVLQEELGVAWYEIIDGKYLVLLENKIGQILGCSDMNEIWENKEFCEWHDLQVREL